MRDAKRQPIHPETGKPIAGKLPDSDRDRMGLSEWMHPDAPGKVRPVIGFVVDRSKTGDYKPIHPDSPIRVQIGGGPDSANHNAYYGRMGFAVDDVDKAQEITKKVRSADTDPLGLYILGAPEMSRSQRQFLDIYLQEMAEHAQRYGKQVEANKAVQEATRYLRRVAAEARKMGAKVPDPFRGISMLPSTPQELREALEKGCLDSFLCDGIWASFWVARSRKN